MNDGDDMHRRPSSPNDGHTNGPLSHGGKLRAICRADIRIGEPLPWSVYDRRGRLLLRRGLLIVSEAQIDRLAENGLFVDAAEDTAASVAASANVMDFLLTTAWGFKPLLNQLLNPGEASDLLPRLHQFAARILKACEVDPAAAVASIHLGFRNPYRLAHPINSAILCELMGQCLGLTKAERISLMCAALTCDLDLFDQPFLEKQATLSNDDLARMRNHPERALALLEKVGVDDQAWLNAVLHHHEQFDGSGYPGGRRRDAIPLGARILSVADSYASLVRLRPWRAAVPPVQAFAELLEGLGTRYDGDIYGALITRIGSRPPGSLVKLESGETAVVRAFAAPTELPVYVLCGRDGSALLSPSRRNALEPGYRIVTASCWSDYRATHALACRLWKRSPFD